MARGRSQQAAIAHGPLRGSARTPSTRSARRAQLGAPSVSAEVRPPTDAAIATALGAVLARDRAASTAHRALMAHGDVFIVGGAVRDVLLGQDPHDVDLMARGIALDDVQRLLGACPGEVILTGKHFGVLRYRHRDGGEVEIALPRTEVSTGDGHADFDAQHDPDLPVERDLERRDFTCNAIGWDITRGVLVDPYGGRDDIIAGQLRCVSEVAFPEDPLRILRGLRARARHGLIPDAATLNLMRDHGQRLTSLSAERIGDEWQELMGTDDPAAGLRLGADAEVLGHIVPAFADPERAELAAVRLQRAAELTTDPVARCAATFTALDDDQAVAARDAAQTLQAMARPRREYERVALLIGAGALPTALDGPRARRVLHRIGRENAEAFIAMRTAAGADPEEASLLRACVARRDPIAIRDLAIGGRELMEEGLRGPEVGRALNAAMEAVLANPSLNTPEALMGVVRGRAAISATG